MDVSPATLPSAATGNLQELPVMPVATLAFVVLISILLLTPFLAAPDSPAPRSAAPESIFVLHLDANGVPALAGQRLDEPELRHRLEQLVVTDPNLGVVIHAEKSVPAERLVGMIDLAKAAGVEHLGLSTP